MLDDHINICGNADSVRASQSIVLAGCDCTSESLHRVPGRQNECRGKVAIARAQLAFGLNKYDSNMTPAMHLRSQLLLCPEGMLATLHCGTAVHLLLHSSQSSGRERASNPRAGR